jgi:hypothetical protein
MRLRRGTAYRRSDLAALALLLVVVIAVAALTMADAAAYIRGDWPSLLFPFYAHLGERLRDLDLPGWNPSPFSGAPFIADLHSGWMYLPAMLLYTLFPALPATTLFVVFHLALAAVAAYVLARLLGLGVGGASVAAVAYALPWLVPGMSGTILFFHVHAWLPVALIGVEIAVRAGPTSRRVAGLALAGLAISQILAAWTGQGGYYALLLIGGWVAWRTLVTPPGGWSARDRLLGLLGIGCAILLIGVALNAPALLPRLDANGRSTIPGGVYTGASRWADTNVGRDLDEIVPVLAGGFSQAGWRYTGAAAIVLALLAPVLALRWPPLGFWLIAGTAAIVLGLAVTTPLHTLSYALLPKFELLHTHLPGRIRLLIPLVVAMLAGATADALARRLPLDRWRLPILLLVGVLALAALAYARQGQVSSGSLLAALAALAVCAVAIGMPVARRAWLAPVALAVIVIWDPTGRVVAAGWGPEAGPQRSLRAAVAGDAEEFLFANGAAAFLTEATRDEPARYAGYDPALLPVAEIAAGDLPPQGYRDEWLGPANWLLVLNWATWFGLDDVQGHNPVQDRRYADYVDALNGHGQEYHDLNLFPAAFASPLLDPLNLRYLVVPVSAPEQPELATMPTVYEDTHVRILENPESFPRAWLVHEARQVDPGAALALLADGTVNPRQTALLESAPPPLALPPDPAAERAAYTVSEPDRLVLKVETAAPALLMLSEVWDPGWSATVDGAPAPVLLANHTFRAVPVPAGSHTVDLHYNPPGLRPGLLIAGATTLLLAAVWLGLRRRERATRARPENEA